MENFEEEKIFEGLEKLVINDENLEKRTGIVYDSQMAHYYCKWDIDYPECPDRYIKSIQQCEKYGLIQRCYHIKSRLAQEEEILLLHDKDYFEKIKKTADITDLDQLENFSAKYDSVYFHENSFKCALLAAGSCIDLVSAVLNNKVRNGMAIIRPPGHHAMKNEACGYCYFNNVALAAKHALINHNVQRILIIDWDVHHGQGTQYMFYDDPRVLYFSIHRYENGEFWPNLRESEYDYVGEREGKGFNINVPLNKTEMGNGDYWAIFTNILLPVAYEYSPELVIISAGYDAAIGCPEGEMKVTPYFYSHLLNSVMGLAEGHICVILEGGYNLSSLSESVAMSLKTLLNDPCPIIDQINSPCESIIESILNVISVHRQFWKSLCLQGSFLIDDDLTDNSRKRYIPSIKYKKISNEEKPESYPTRNCYPQHNSEKMEKLEFQIQSLIKNTVLSKPLHCTALIYDSRMTLHHNSSDREHPEKPSRIYHIYNKLKDSGLTDKCHILKARHATEEEITLLHDIDYVQKIKDTEKIKPKELQLFQKNLHSVYLCKSTYQCALLAVGCALEVVDSVLIGNSQNGIAIVRPPGHHAEINAASGFCIFNTVAIAAKYGLTRYNVKRILIVDWDIHHGNGTQHAFYDDCRVLYISIHRYDHGLFFPYSNEGDFNAVGENAGKGFNINIPWNEGGKSDGDYMSAFFHIILPIAYQFNPELVLVSSGFDAAKGDPLGGCFVTPECFGHMTRLLSGLSNGKIILILEGGYNLASISESMKQCVASLLGDPIPSLSTELKPSPSAICTIKNVLKVHEEYWTSLRFDVDLPVEQYCSESFSSVKESAIAISLNSTEKEKCSFTKDDEELRGAYSSSYFNEPAAYCVVPLKWCPHLENLQPLPSTGLNPFSSCQKCGDINENWVCLHCYEVYCGRYVRKHMLQHGTEKKHSLTLSFSDLSVWCYECDSYIHSEELLPMKEEAHFKKFGYD